MLKRLNDVIMPTTKTGTISSLKFVSGHEQTVDKGSRIPITRDRNEETDCRFLLLRVSKRVGMTREHYGAQRDET